MISSKFSEFANKNGSRMLCIRQPEEDVDLDTDFMKVWIQAKFIIHLTHKAQLFMKKQSIQFLKEKKWKIDLFPRTCIFNPFIQTSWKKRKEDYYSQLMERRFWCRMQMEMKFCTKKTEIIEMWNVDKEEENLWKRIIRKKKRRNIVNYFKKIQKKKKQSF